MVTRMRELLAMLLLLASPWSKVHGVQPIPQTPAVNITAPANQTAVAKYGALSVNGTHLVDAAGQIVQLRGVATIGLQWFWEFYRNGVAIESAAKDWNVEVVRVTVYIYEGGYLDNEELAPEDFDVRIFSMVDTCVANEMYCIIDWHVHHPGFPSFYLEDSKPFFDKMAKRYAGVPNVMYEIANEPSKKGYKNITGHEVPWSEVKEYADEVIPVIRKHSPEAVVLVGTPAWSSLGLKAEIPVSWEDIVAAPLQMKNVLYVLHFYAAETEYWTEFPAVVDAAAEKLPLFVTEWSSASYFVDSEHDMVYTATWLKLLDKHKIGWTYWNFGNSGAVYSPFSEGTVAMRQNLHPRYGNVTETGELLYSFLNP